LKSVGSKGQRRKRGKGKLNSGETMPVKVCLRGRADQIDKKKIEPALKGGPWLPRLIARGGPRSGPGLGLDQMRRREKRAAGKWALAAGRRHIEKKEGGGTGNDDLFVLGSWRAVGVRFAGGGGPEVRKALGWVFFVCEELSKRGG